MLLGVLYVDCISGDKSSARSVVTNLWFLYKAEVLNTFTLSVKHDHL